MGINLKDRRRWRWIRFWGLSSGWPQQTKSSTPREYSLVPGLSEWVGGQDRAEEKMDFFGLSRAHYHKRTFIASSSKNQHHHSGYILGLVVAGGLTDCELMILLWPFNSRPATSCPWLGSADHDHHQQSPFCWTWRGAPFLTRSHHQKTWSRVAVYYYLSKEMGLWICIKRKRVDTFEKRTRLTFFDQHNTQSPSSPLHRPHRPIDKSLFPVVL